MRFRWRHHPDASAAALPRESAETVVELDTDQLRELSAVFAAPRWLRDLGIASWLIVGVVALVVGLVWILGITSTIVEPVLTGLVLAVVASPAVGWFTARGIPRAAGALLVLLGIVAVAVVLTLLVINGLTGQADAIRANLTDALETLESWLVDAGVEASGAASATETVEASAPEILHTFIEGVAAGISGIASLAFGFSFTAFSLFFLLKDGPAMRNWVDRHLGVPEPVAKTITGGVITSLRRYFLGVTIVAAFNAVVVGLGSLALDVPLAGTIAVVVFVTAYIPFVGAVISGAFAVFIALGAQGTETALVMLVIVILANGLLQNVVQPVAFGATLRLNPLVVLVVTISAGALFGMVGLVLAAPLTSAAVHIKGQLDRASAEALAAGLPAKPEPPPPIID